jgi:hypothetical protein
LKNVEAELLDYRFEYFVATTRSAASTAAAIRAALLDFSNLGVE